MATPAQLARAKQQTTIPQSLGSPIGGWNTRDPYEAMEPQDAVVLDNWLPDFGGVISRAGTTIWASELGTSPVQTLAVFQNGPIVKLLAACSGKIFDVSNGGTPLAALGSEFASDRWQTVNFNGRLQFVNGVDPPQSFDGTALTPNAWTGAGLNPNLLKGCGVFNSRLYFWDGQSPGFWYGSVDAITGPLTFFPFNMVTPDGANLLAISVLSYDGGTGIDDYTIFVLTSGEMLVYQGTDPADPNNWALSGRYTIGLPVDMRAVVRYGGDVYIATSNDHTQLSQLLIALKLGTTPPRTKISGAAAAAYLAGSKLTGWQAIYYPAGRLLIFNIPNADGTFAQHVFNTATQAWCRYLGINAYCLGTFGDNLYMGAANGVVLLSGGLGDEQSETLPPWDTSPWDTTPWATINASAISCSGQQAWNLFDSPLTKRVAAVRPMVQSVGSTTATFALGYDYQPVTTLIPIAQKTSGSPWDISPWDTSPWSAETTTSAAWRTAAGKGSAISCQLNANTFQQLTWIRTDLRIEQGTAL